MNTVNAVFSILKCTLFLYLFPSLLNMLKKGNSRLLIYLKTKRKPFLVRLSNTDDYRVYPKREKKLNRHFFSNSKRHNKEIQYLHLYVFFRVKIASTLIVLILYLVLYSARSRNLYRLTDYGNVIVLNSIFYWSCDCVLIISILSRKEA